MLSFYFAALTSYVNTKKKEKEEKKKKKKEKKGLRQYFLNHTNDSESF